MKRLLLGVAAVVLAAVTLYVVLRQRPASITTTPTQTASPSLRTDANDKGSAMLRAPVTKIPTLIPRPDSASPEPVPYIPPVRTDLISRAGHEAPSIIAGMTAEQSAAEFARRAQDRLSPEQERALQQQRMDETRAREQAKAKGLQKNEAGASPTPKKPAP